MLGKNQLPHVWEIAFSEWSNNDDDCRKHRELIVDFTYECIESATAPLVKCLKDTNQLLSVLLADPLVHKDQKAFLKARLEANIILLNEYPELKKGVSSHV